MHNIAKYIMLMRCTRHNSKKVSLAPHERGREIANRMITTRLPGLPIVNKENNEVTGVVTEYNIIEALRVGMNLDEVTAEEIKSDEPITADIDTPVEDLIDIMRKNNLSMIPVTKNRKLAGIIDICSIMELYMSPGFDRFLQ